MVYTQGVCECRACFERGARSIRHDDCGDAGNVRRRRWRRRISVWRNGRWWRGLRRSAGGGASSDRAAAAVRAATVRAAAVRAAALGRRCRPLWLPREPLRCALPSRFHLRA